MAATKPIIVAVHGAWHSPEHFAPLETALTSHGYKMVSVWLPSMHYARVNQPPPMGLAEDIEAIHAAVLLELASQMTTDVLLLTHSYSSIPGLAAVESLDKASRAQAGHSNGVAAVLVISGLLVPAGISAFAWAGNEVPPTVTLSTIPSPEGYPKGKEIEVSNPISVPGPIALFYHDLPPDEAAKYAALLKPQIFAVNHTPVPFVGYKVIPTYYLVCEDDRALPPVFQRVMIENANKDIAEDEAHRLGDRDGENGGTLAAFQRESLAGKTGRKDEEGEKAADGHSSGNQGEANPTPGGGPSRKAFIHVDTVQSGHSPFLSRVEETAAWVRRCAGEEV